MRANCCTNINNVIEWFKDLKQDGVTKDEILDVLEFDSDQYPDMEILKKAREIVFA